MRVCTQPWPKWPYSDWRGVVGVAELLVELLQVAQVVAEPVGCDGGVLPALPGVAARRDVRGRAEPGLADLPQLVLVRGVVEERDVGVVLGVAERVEHARARARRPRRWVSPPNCTIRKPSPSGSSLERVRVEALDLLVVDEAVVEALERDRLVRQDRGHGVGGVHDVVEAEHDEACAPSRPGPARARRAAR